MHSSSFHVRYTLRPCHLPWLDHSICVWRRGQIRKLNKQSRTAYKGWSSSVGLGVA
jgi:hypothetical protein